MGTQVIYPDESYRIMGAAFEVYKVLGCGFLEAIYQEALAIEFRERDIPFLEPVRLRVHYKGRLLAKEYESDFMCFDKIILELKAVRDLEPSHEAQLHNYLKATGIKLGLLLNFGHYPLLQHRRIVR